MRKQEKRSRVTKKTQLLIYHDICNYKHSYIYTHIHIDTNTRYYCITVLHPNAFLIAIVLLIVFETITVI